MKKILFLLLILSEVVTPAATLLINSRNFTSEPTMRRKTTITRTDGGVFVVGPWLIDGDSVSKFTDTNGNAYYSNALAANYRLEISGSPGRSYPFSVPDTNGVLNVADLINTTNINASFYTAAQVNALISNINAAFNTGTNLVTLITNANGTITFSVSTQAVQQVALDLGTVTNNRAAPLSLGGALNVAGAAVVQSLGSANGVTAVTDITTSNGQFNGLSGGLTNANGSAVTDLATLTAATNLSAVTASNLAFRVSSTNSTTGNAATATLAANATAATTATTAISATNINTSALGGLFESYADRENLGNAGRLQLLNIQTVINNLGVASNLVDGCFYRAGLNSQTVVPATLKGVAPATNELGWSWETGGILTSNSAAGRLIYPVQDCTNGTTLIIWTAGLPDSAFAAGHVASLANTNGTASGQLLMFCPDSNGNIILQHYAGGGVTTTSSLRAVRDFSLRGMSSAWSLNGKIENMVDERYAESAGNSDAHTALNHLWIGGLASRFTCAGWLLFDKKLTTNQIKAINYSLPRTRVIVEGDSISLNFYTNSAARMAIAGMGLWTNQAVSGETTVNMLSETNEWKNLGPDGTNVTDTFISIMGGANDIANLSSSAGTILTNLRVLWATARANNIKPIAWTVTGGYGIRGVGLDTNRIQLNQMIRADGSNYHQLIDVDAYLLATLGPQYYSNTTYFPDNLHPGVLGCQLIGPLLGDVLKPAAKITDKFTPPWGMRTFYPTLIGTRMPTNYNAADFVPVPGYVIFAVSNNAVYSVSTTKTNLIVAP